MAGAYQIHEPLQHHRRVVGDLEEAQQADDQRDNDAVDRYTRFRALGQEPGRFTLQRQTEQAPTGAIHIAVTRTERSPQNHRIDDIRQNANLQPIHRNHVRRRSSTRLARRIRSNELLIVIRHINPNRQTTQYEESRQTVKDRIERLGHDDSRILRLPGRHGDVVGPGDGETRLDQALQEAEETAEVAAVVELCEGARVAPVAEAEAVVLRVAAKHGDEGVDY